jgi:hypothetical protein
MPIALENERRAGLPVVKRTALNQTFHGAILLVEPRDRLRKDDATGALVPLLKLNGKPRQELVVTCLTLPRTTAPVGLGDDEHVPEPEEIVRLILKGKAFADWLTAKKELDRPVNVGDIVTQVTDRAQVYDANGNPSGAELTDQVAVNAVPRGRSIGIYGPITVRAPKEGSPWVAKAESAYHSLQEPIVAESSDLPPEPPDDDEPPF